VDRVHGAWIGRRGSGPRWTEAARTRGRGCALPTCDTLGAMGLGGSPAAAGDEEGDEAKPVKGSLGHGRWWRGGAAAETDSGDSSSSCEWRRARESSEVRGRGVVRARGAQGFT
jgi:hypothetical protein